MFGIYGNSFFFYFNSTHSNSLNHGWAYISLKSFEKPILAEDSYYNNLKMRSLHSLVIVIPFGKWNSPLHINFMATSVFKW